MKRVLFVLCLLLAACAKNRDSYTTYDSELLEISFAYPQSWFLKANALELNVATDESLFVTTTANFSNGAVANFSLLPAEAVNGDLVAALSQFTSFVAANEGVAQVGEVALFTVNGRSAAQAKVNLTQTATLLVTMIQNGEQAILVTAVYDDAQYEAMMTAMVESIVFME